MKINLSSLKTEHLEMLHIWMNTKHLFPFYMQQPISIAELHQKFTHRITTKHKTKCLLAETDGTYFGYAQWYLNADYPDHGASLIGKELGFSIDYFIGEPRYLGKSLGSKMLKKLTQKVFEIVNDDNKVAYITHDVLNQPAIKCTKKAGFKLDRQLVENGKKSLLFSLQHSF